MYLSVDAEDILLHDFQQNGEWDIIDSKIIQREEDLSAELNTTTDPFCWVRQFSYQIIISPLTLLYYAWPLHKKYVSLLVEICKNNGYLSCVAIDLFSPGHFPLPELIF